MSADNLRGLDDPDAAPRGGGLDRIWAIWARRKWLGVVVFVLPLVAMVTGLMALPDLYESSALVLVERQQVPEAFVRSTVTSQLEIRLHTISQEILSRSRLEALVTRLGLYPELRGQGSTEEATDRMRRDIRLELKSAEAGKAGATTSFSLSYRGANPQTVAVVTNTLASFYIEENLKARERQAAGTSEFLRVQLADAKKRLDEQETKMGELQRRYQGELPQQLQGNLMNLEAMNQQLRYNNDSQVRLSQRRDQLAEQLAQSKVSEGGGPEPDEVRLARLKQELVTLRVKYTDLWPDIIRIKDEIERLEKDLAKPKPKTAPKTEEVALTPQGYRIQEQIQLADTEMKLAKQEERRLKATIEQYQKRLENAPKREQEYLDATRDYQSTKEHYHNLTKRFEEAQLAESMEQRQKGEQFRILDSAVPSGTPTAPRRARLLMMSLAASLALGAAAMVLAEVLDTSFHSTADLRAYTTIPVLVNIPRITTHDDARRVRWRFRFAAASVLVGIVLVAGSAYFVAHGNEPLAQLLSRGART
ncbi:MAG TPA: GNVR domain-containing protein [Thermoanaerobaculia bacterium]|nr:GNVR domain-containing protein [Thermoanaerobaculia bacterium]